MAHTCISHFFFVVVVKKYIKEKQSGEENGLFSFTLPEDKVSPGGKLVAAERHGGRSRRLAGHIFILTQEVHSK